MFMKLYMKEGLLYYKVRAVNLADLTLHFTNPCRFWGLLLH